MRHRFVVDAGVLIDGPLRATWDPGLVRTPRVLVPIVVDALIVRNDERKGWADCRMAAPPTMPEGSPPVDARSLLPRPFTDLPEPRARGIYLHWALPDGLTAGTISTPPGEAANVTLPAAPDRWLVLRLSTGRDATRRAVEGWVLESGGAEPVVTRLDDWHGPGAGTTERPMTAMGYGDPAWAAYFDNVENRLGFHDPATGVTGPIAYLVCGWYSDPAHDPLGSGIRPVATFEETLDRLGWRVQGELRTSQEKLGAYVKRAAREGLRAKDLPWATHVPRRDPDGNYVSSGDWWPSSTLFHGAAVDLAWPGGSAVAAGGPPRADDLRVILGATSGEALAAALASEAQNPDEERVVEAFQLGVLHELDEPDGRTRLDALLHASGFGSLPGGPDEIERIWEPPVPPQPAAPDHPGTPDAGVFANRRASGAKRGRVPVAREAEAVIDAAVGNATTNPAISPGKVLGSEAVLGRLPDYANRLRGDAAPPGQTPRPGRWVEVRRPQPRFHRPVDPFVLLQGAKRSFKHGGDGRWADDGRLACRLSGFTVRSISVDLAGATLAHATVAGEQLLSRGVQNGSVPIDCEELLRETVLLDPGSATAAVAQLLAAGDLDRTGRVPDNWRVEQTAWWVTNDPRLDPTPVLTRSGITGTLPSPLAISPPNEPWNPLHLDWEVEFTPSAGGINDWQLDEIDFRPDSTTGATAAAAAPVVVSGRALVTAGAARTLAEAARSAIEAGATSGGADVLPPRARVRYASKTAKTIYEHMADVSVRAADKVKKESGDERADLSTIVDLLDRMDILGGALDGFHLGLRGGAPPLRPVRPDGTPDPTPISPPTGFLALRAGTLRVTRLRLVDGFGQYLVLTGTGETLTGPADPSRLVLGETVRSTGTAGLAVLTPRFTAPARLLLRWADATLDAVGPGANPVCGYVMPDHLDGGLEFFAADGTNLGNLRADEHPDRSGALLWEQAPGSPTTVGRPPSLDVANPFLRGLAEGLLDWGMADHGTRPGGSAPEEGALEALLRIVDSTMWSVDPFGHAGDEHLALLVGHPVAVMRVVLRLEVVDPATPADLAWTPVSVRLGALTQWQDGLLAFYVGDDYGAVHCAPAAAAMAREVGPQRGFLQQAQAVRGFYDGFAADLAGSTSAGTSPVTHPYVSPSDFIVLRPNQDVRLTFLMEPHTLVHATTGLLPRKDIGMRREWVASAQAALEPSFRFGPVLRDPDTLRMPIATDVGGTWTWNHKADVVRWLEEQILNASHDAFLDDTPAEGSEGWLRLTPPPAPTEASPPVERRP